MGQREYQNWNGSRWQYTKSQSKWHFDTTRTDTQDYQPICQFIGDWDYAVERCLKRAIDATWASRNYFSADPDANKKRMYSADAEELDLLKAGADPYMKIFQRAMADDFPIFQNIANYFGLSDASIKFHNQKTGQMLNLHIDNFAGRPERGNSFKVTKVDKNPALMKRFVVMLDDWKHGQMFALGNQVWHQWRRGDCITWEWRDIPHATCNMGWSNRPMLQITGWTTDRTYEIVKAGSFDTTVIVSNDITKSSQQL